VERVVDVEVIAAGHGAPPVMAVSIGAARTTADHGFVDLHVEQRIRADVEASTFQAM
jgi:hypothetical protein